MWKLAATERRFPAHFPRGYLTADRVTHQLRYRCALCDFHRSRTCPFVFAPTLLETNHLIFRMHCSMHWLEGMLSLLKVLLLSPWSSKAGSGDGINYRYRMFSATSTRACRRRDGHDLSPEPPTRLPNARQI